MLHSLSPTPAHDLIARFGTTWNKSVADETLAAYLPVHRDTPKDGVHVTRDLPYGPDERHCLDVYRPHTPGRHPVVLFFHGGGLWTGDKTLPDSDGLVYANLGAFLARHGFVAVLANYRLVPHVRFPGGGEDVARVVAWAHEHIAEYGGDPQALILFGNSAGGVHAATYLFGQSLHPPEGPGVAAAVLLSVPCTLPYGGPREQVTKAYFGARPEQIDANAPLGLLRAYDGPAVPLLFMTAEYDPDEIERPSVKFLSAYGEKFGTLPRFSQVPGHNHLSTVLSLNTEDESLAGPLLAFLKEVNRAGRAAPVMETSR
ncbi:alpha/beta hydrolase [Deinococcus geothermalis]|uniref:Lipase, alpha/beta superfamily hydrolase n=1 Tax=Deinococcus geothermalis (strain DSM 11300 / CIP 105573 / AG-3a) TaxID=319795 RepID=Q1J2S0_DEIGD|nr:alpha/beta hydrolase [Deinococcus geothermalis]ABF44214.1 Lipase, alpha/beta superfamily hydrolase [Deinococcus geothermalis DSM 11300]